MLVSKLTEDAAPQELLELAETFREYARRATGVELDYSSDTLPVLDRYLELARTDVSGRQEAESIVSRTATAYFGEVIRQLIDGFWLYEPGDMLKWAVCSRRVFCEIRPAIIILEALRQAAVDSPAVRLAPEDAAEIQRRLGALPEVSEQEYFLPSTRYDAIEIVFSALSDQGSADGMGDVSFDAEDYRQ